MERVTGIDSQKVEVTVSMPATDSAVANKEIGDAYTRLGQYKDAIKEYDKATRLRPNFTEDYNNREVAYFMQGKRAGCYDAQKACEWGNCGLLEKAKNMGVCR